MTQSNSSTAVKETGVAAVAAVPTVPATEAANGILLLARLDSSENGADQAYALISVTREGLSSLRRIGALVSEFNSENAAFNSAQFYAPAGVTVQIIIDTDDEVLEGLLNGEAGERRAIVLAGGDRLELIVSGVFEERSNLIVLKAADAELLEEAAEIFAPNYVIDSRLIRYYNENDLYFYIMFKFCEGCYSFDSISLERIAPLFGDSGDEREEDFSEEQPPSVMDRQTALANTAPMDCGQCSCRSFNLFQPRGALKRISVLCTECGSVSILQVPPPDIGIEWTSDSRGLLGAAT